jgi:hypothetical protein
MSYDDAAEVMTAITGRAVRHRGVDATTYVDFLLESGYDGDFASALAALDQRIRDGDEANVTDAVERLTGEPPRSFADFLRERAGIPR